MPISLFVKRDCIKDESDEEQEQGRRSSAGAARDLKSLLLAEVQAELSTTADRKEIDEMRASLRLIVSLSLLVFVIGTSHAYAQRRVPETGMWGVGGWIGAGVPMDASLDNGFGFAGNVERYVTPRVSIRGQLGGTWADIVGRHFTGTVNPVFLDGNVVYNWEGGNLHPFVTGGGGIYFYKSSIDGSRSMTDTKPGLDFGGGLELFFDRRTTMTAEALYHVVSSVDSALATFPDGKFWTFGVGVKRYF